MKTETIRSFGDLRRVLDLPDAERTRLFELNDAQAAQKSPTSQADRPAQKPTVMALSSIALRPLRASARKDWVARFEQRTGQNDY